MITNVLPPFFMVHSVVKRCSKKSKLQQLQLLQTRFHSQSHNFSQYSGFTIPYPRVVANNDVVWWRGRRRLEAPVPVVTVRAAVKCDGSCRWERTPRVTAGSTDDDRDLGAPTDRVLVDTERLVHTASSLCLQFDTEYDTVQSVILTRKHSWSANLC